MQKSVLRWIVALCLATFICFGCAFLVRNNGTAVSADTQITFSMDEGAGVRLSDTTGIRFTASLDKATYDYFNNESVYSDVQFGMFVMPKYYSDSVNSIYGKSLSDRTLYCFEEGDEGVFVWGKKVEGKAEVLHYFPTPVPVDADGNVTVDESEAVGYVLRASIVNVNDNHLADKYTAEAYVKLTAINGDVTYVMADLADANSFRSVIDVAIRKLDSGATTEEQEILNGFIDTYKTWYKDEYGMNPTYSYTVKYYRDGGFVQDAVQHNVEIGTAISVTPDASKVTETAKTVDDYKYNAEASETTGKVYADNDLVLTAKYVSKQQKAFTDRYAESVNGAVSCGTVYSGAYKVLVGTANETANFNATNFSLALSDTNVFKKANWNKQLAVKIYCTDTVVSGNITYVTQEINTPAELNAFGATAQAVAGDTWTGVWDGYFVLGNDIFFSNDYIPFGYYEDFRVHQNGSATGYNDAVNKGFKGTFDGKGHVIDTLRTTWANVPYYGGTSGRPGACAFISLLNQEGVIKNVAFTNGCNASNNSFLVNIGAGTVEDVYIQMGSQSSGNPNNNDKSGIICGNSSTQTLRIRRVFIDSSREDTLTAAYSIGRIYEKAGVLQDVTVISHIPAIASIGTGTGAANIYGRFENRQHLIDANPNYTGWVSTNPTMWSMDADGIIIPTAMVGKVYDTTIGVSLCDFANDKYEVTLPFSVSTKSAYSSIGWGINRTISADGNKVSFVGKNDFNGRLRNQVLTVADGSVIRWIKMTVATLTISNYQDLNRLPTVAKAQCSEPYLWGGLFMLTNDIQYGTGIYDPATAGGYRGFPFFCHYNAMVAIRNTGNWPKVNNVNVDWNDPRYLGFKGTFDGNGYNIDGMFIGQSYGGVAGGFMGILHQDGVIKNVSFTHAFVSDNVGFLTCSCGGTINDVYVHLDLQGNGDKFNRCSIVASQTYAVNVGTAAAPVYQYSMQLNRIVYVVDSHRGNDVYSTPIGEFYDYAQCSRGDADTYDYIQNVGGYGNNNAQYNNNAYNYSGIRWLGNGNGGDGKGHWVHCAGATDRDNFIGTGHYWVVQGCVSGNPGFWKYDTVNAKVGDRYGITTRHLNGSDI